MSATTRVAPVRPAERPPVWAPMAAAAAFIVYAFAIPVLVSVGVAQTEASWAGASSVLLVISIYSAVRLALELRRGASRWFVLVFFTFTYVFLGVVPLIQIGARTLLWAVEPVPDVLVAAAIVCLAGILVFDVGLWLGSLRPARSMRRRGDRVARTQVWADPRSEPKDLQSDGSSVRAIDQALMFLLGLTALSMVVLWMRGGLPLVLASRSGLDAALCSVGTAGGLVECGVVSALVRVPPVILTIVALGMGHKGHRLVGRLAIMIGIVALLITANPVSTARFWVGAAIIGVLGARLFHSLRARVLIWLLLPALLIILFPVLDFARTRSSSWDFSIHLDSVIQKQDFDAYQQIVNGITYVDIYGMRSGAQLSSTLLFFVPRSVWSDKAPATGSLVTASLGVTDNTNVSAPIWEEAYVDFGFGGMLVVMSALGYGVARLESAVQKSLLRRGGLTSIVAPFFAGYGLYFLRGSLLAAVGPLAVAGLLVWVTSHLSSSPRQPLGHQSTPAIHPARAPGLLRLAPDASRDQVGGLPGRVNKTAICESKPRTDGVRVHDG